MRNRIGILIFMVCLLLNFSCKKDVEYHQVGILTGPDMALCVCCGGVILKINNDTNYRVDSLPGMTAQELFALDFPKNIRFNATTRNTCGGLDYLTVIDYKITN
ncbi:MAG: hypothetical protein GC171_03365 [Terrimonas sp.]|nr:hypothetical protein [Terrimonas sp.]